MIEKDGETHESHGICPDCGGQCTRVWGVLRRDPRPAITYFASCYDHDGPEAYIDVIFSPTWDDAINDHFTFGCRVGAVVGSDDPGATLVPAASAWDESRTFGRKLERAEAQRHAQLGEFWEIVDYVIANEHVVHSHLYGLARD